MVLILNKFPTILQYLIDPKILSKDAWKRDNKKEWVGNKPLIMHFWSRIVFL